MNKNHDQVLHYFFHNHKWNPEAIEYYIYKILRTIAFSLISVFLPIFLYVDVGYSLFEIMLFFAINQIYFLAFIPFSGKVIEKIGIKHAIAIHLPGMALFIYGLRFLSGDFVSDLWVVFLILAIRSIPKSSMGGAEVLFMSKNILNEDNNEGKSLAYIKIILIFASLVAPLIGGLITFLFGFEYFFNIVIIFTVLTAVPLFLTKDEYFKNDETPQRVWNFTLKNLSKDFQIAEFGRWGVEMILWILWPLFIYIIVQSTLELGIIVSTSAIIAMLVSYYVGKLIDKKPSKELLNKMTKTQASIFFLRTLFPNPFIMVFTDAINKIANPVLMIPYEKFRFKYIKSQKNLLEMSIATNLLAEIAATVAIVLFALVFGILEYLKIGASYLVFTGIFITFGLGYLLMDRIANINYEK